MGDLLDDLVFGELSQVSIKGCVVDPNYPKMMR